MKKEYEVPQFEIVNFFEEDILTASNGVDLPDDEFGDTGSGGGVDLPDDEFFG